ncbi:MerR family transcriptional regulator [Nocardia sp. NPDC006044]|uniref:MerR family transcriptional regulator n=1 Tax=Nocardia sp. NPDC006044 TaxID=3364306 RepID=UPI0036C148D6
MAAGVEYTIDELARAAGTTVRTIRVYHERGALPPPQVKGRTGFYGPEHLVRMQTINRLMAQGVKVNGIKELFDAYARGEDLADLLGVPDGFETPMVESPIDDTITGTELQERYRDVRQGLARVVAIGLYEPVDAATYRVGDRDLMRVADQLAAAGIPEDEVLGELEKLHADSERVARRLVDLFRRTAWAAYEKSGDSAELAQRAFALRAAPGRAGTQHISRLVGRYLDLDAELSEALSGDQ